MVALHFVCFEDKAAGIAAEDWVISNWSSNKNNWVDAGDERQAKEAGKVELVRIGPFFFTPLHSILGKSGSDT